MIETPNSPDSEGWQSQALVTDSLNTLVIHFQRYLLGSAFYSRQLKVVANENFYLVWPEIPRMIQAASAMIETQSRCMNFSTYYFGSFSDFSLVDFMANENNFHISFSLQGIPVLSRFVARDVEIGQLRQQLLPTSANERCRKVLVLRGLGGIGKTQLAVEFAQRYETSYSAVFWINGSTKESLRQSFADIASRLPRDQICEITKTYSQEESSNNDQVVDEVLKWLSQPMNNQWLLIFDNVDREVLATCRDREAFDVTEYFPKANQGSILVTSRLASLRQLGVDLKLEPVDEVQGKNILENSLGKSVEGQRT